MLDTTLQVIESAQVAQSQVKKKLKRRQRPSESLVKSNSLIGDSINPFVSHVGTHKIDSRASAAKALDYADELKRPSVALKAAATTATVKKRLEFLRKADSFASAVNAPDPPEHSEHSTSIDRSSVLQGLTQNDDISMEQFRKIKAKTMYNMIEDLGDGRRLLFLTNVQADLIAASTDSLQKMLDVFEIPKPKLVINLLCSLGWDPNVDRNYELQKAGNMERVYGLVQNKPPFSQEEVGDKEGKQQRRPEVLADEALDKFMLEVVIPLAARTNAIVFCAAEPRSCVLSRSFTRMVSMQRAKWGFSLPFFVLSTTKDVDDLVRNRSNDAYWKKVCAKSPAWTQRAKEIDRCLLEDERAWNADGELVQLDIDLDPNAMCFLIVDGVATRDGKLCWDGTSFTTLLRQLVSYLSSSVPSIALKTGQAASATFENAHSRSSSLSIALNRALSGTPVLLLDVVKRGPFPKDVTKRTQIIEFARGTYDEYCDKLINSRVADVLDTCALAYFQRVLEGDLRKDKEGHLRPAAIEDVEHVTLHDAVQRARHMDRRTKGNQEQEKEEKWDEDVAAPGDIADVAAWLANRRYKDAWEVLPDDQKDKKGHLKEADEKGFTASHETFFKKNIQQHAAVARSLLSSPNVHGLNLIEEDLERVKRVVGDLVKLEQPKQNRLEGLLLLQEAWKEYDVAMHLAGWYKKFCKFLFLAQLLLTWLVSICSSFGGSFTEKTTGNGNIMPQVVFGLAAAMSILVSLDGVLSSKARWRKLRMSAGVLEASIWCYRSRVGKFTIARHEAHVNAPELELQKTLNEWREDLVEGANLAASSLQKVYPDSIYRHGQCASTTRRPLLGCIARKDLSDPRQKRRCYWLCLKRRGDFAAAAQSETSTRMDGDDHFSPVRPDFYIRQRIEVSMEFYQGRIPKYARLCNLLKAFILLLGVTSSILAHFDLLSYTVIVSAGSSAMTSWSEFADVSRKVERYSHTVLSLKKLLSWWNSLDEVEKAAAENISVLVCTSENIISEERFAWVSAGKQEKALTDTGETQKSESTGVGKPIERQQAVS